MHPLLNIDHILHQICSYAPRHELPALARVSSTWFRYAISHLYRHVGLEKALAPLGKIVNYNGVMEFVHPLSDKDLERFSKHYAPYVRVLRISSDHQSIALKAIRKGVSMGIPYLFPNIQTLKWYSIDHSPACIEISIGLISPKIERLSLDIRDHRILYYLCPLIMTRLPVLCGLYIILLDIGEEDEALIDPLRVHVQGLLPVFARTLTCVHLSRCFYTPSITERLSEMHSLCNLTIGESPTTRLQRSGILGDGDFPSLRSLSFDGVLSLFYPMFTNPVENLAFLTILCLNNVTPGDVDEFISFVVVAFPYIYSLTFGECIPEPFNLNYPSTLVPWRSIKPISNCPYLFSLTLNWIRISVSMEELTEFLKSRTTWTCLDIWTADPLRLQDILLYAKHCPDLQHVGLHLDDRVEFSIEDLPNDSDHIPMFSALDSINLAYGRDMSKSNSHILAKFLYRACNKRLFTVSRPEIELTDYIAEELAGIYYEEKCRTGEPMSSEVEEFVNRRRQIE